MKRMHVRQTRTIFQWFFMIFISISLLFCIALIPLFIYLQNIFSDLQLEKSRQQLAAGASEIQSVVTGMLNISEALSEDSRFITLRYAQADYSAITSDIRNQLKNIFSNLMFPLESVSHAALQLDQNVVIADSTVFFEDHTCYYPDFFSVNDLTYTEWSKLLADNGTGFLPACHVKTPNQEYDALIFSTKWTRSTYLYACIKIADIKELLLADTAQSNCYFTITTSGGKLLYSDLPDAETEIQTLSEDISAGNLHISIHIPDSIFYQKMQPLYIFMMLYASLCIVMLIVISLLGTRFSSKPVLDIIQLLDRSKNILVTDRQHTGQHLPSSFDYIYNSIQSADQHLGEYQSTILTQQKILQARFLEKAINGQLISSKNIQQFHSYFPDFPENYRLMLIKLWTYTEGEHAPYADPLLLLQSFLESELPHAYQQQLNDTELLLLISETDFDHSCKILDFLVENINREEPSYFIRCVASGIYQHLENLPAAYHQIQDIDRFTLHGDRTRVCTVSDCEEVSDWPFTMTDLLTLYTAITYSNHEMAMSKLHTYSEALRVIQNTSWNRHVYEMLRTVLNSIRLEYPQQLIDQHIPAYRADISPCDQLADTVSTFCRLLTDDTKTDIDPFARELFQYIDTHYTDCDLCITSLETRFKCSESTIRKAFKSVTDVTVSRYIEQKRMDRANELLAQNQKTIAEISFECGFSSPNSFYKAYRRVYGHAPTMPETTRNLP